jgi:hypothetical protein
MAVLANNVVQNAPARTRSSTSTGRGIKRCPHCNKYFFNPTNFRVHMSQEHTAHERSTNREAHERSTNREAHERSTNRDAHAKTCIRILNRAFQKFKG